MSKKGSYWDSHYKYAVYSKPLTKGSLAYDRRKIYLDLLKPKSKDARIVDLACSVGHIMTTFYQEGYANVTGVDLDSGSIQAGKLMYPSLKDKFVEDDIINWLSQAADKRDSYDYLLLINILEHLDIKSIKKIFRTLPKVISKGGKVIIKVPNAGTVYSNRYLYDDYTHQTYLTIRSMMQLLREVGYEDSSFSFHDDPYVIQGRFKFVQKIAFKVMRYLDKLLLGESPNNKFQFPTIICIIEF